VHIRVCSIRVFPIASLLLVASCSKPPDPAAGPTSPPARITEAPDSPRIDSTFWSHWGDGKAELAGYDLTYPRYGQLRSGVAVTIFVTEPFSNSLRVKADPGKHPASDQFPVMKLNLIKDFQTGIYDYNTMLSSFVTLAAVNGRPTGSAAKASYSSQEWCGHVYQQLLFDDQSIHSISHSYFDGEADQQKEIDYPPDGVTEDILLLWARGLARPVPIPGETRQVHLLTSLQRARESHTPLSWKPATLSRSRGTLNMTVPAGNFEVEVWSVEIEGGAKKTFYVEKASPHRVIRWESSDGERADLLGSDRLEYWKMNGKGGEEALKKLGLSPRPPRTT
jgi:hypothetical protein